MKGSPVRITGGQARGRTVTGPISAGVRPTSSRVREAVFSLVGQDLTGLRVLDAFGGTGLLGFEAWSRGARVVVVEKDPTVARSVLSSCADLGAEVEVRCGDVLALAPSLGVFDGILVDPPYALDPGPILAVLGGLARDWLVLESRVGTAAPEAAPLRLDRRRTYGDSALTVYRAPEGG